MRFISITFGFCLVGYLCRASGVFAATESTLAQQTLHKTVAPTSSASSVPSIEVSAQPHSQAALVDGIDIDELVEQMSIEHRVGQLLYVDIAGHKVDSSALDLVAHKRVGGVAFFGHNIKSRKQVRAFTKAIVRLDHGGIPPFISVDQEGGSVVRIKDAESVLPSAMALGATRSVELASIAGRVVGRDLRSLGFTMNLAPVLDVNSNPRNPVIGIRSYGERPELVADLGMAFIHGMQSAGIVAVAKHFPGHGATTADSHYALPSLPYDMQRLRAVELLPFARSIDAGLEAVMTAHIALPHIAEEADLPATLSHRVLTGILRDELGFKGIVITDGLEMRGIVERYGLGRAAVKAVLAGADMVLVVWTNERKEEARLALLDAVANNEISIERLNTSVRRILTAKARHQMLPGQKPVVTTVTALDRQVNRRIAMRAVTLVRNEGQVLPLKAERGRTVLVVSNARVFGKLLKKNLKAMRMREVLLRLSPSKTQRRHTLQLTLEQAQDADVVVVGLANSYYTELVHALKQRFPQKPVVVVSFGSPYVMHELPEVDAYVCTYSGQESSQLAAAYTLVGRNQPTGKLPVSLSESYSFGHGLGFGTLATIESGPPAGPAPIVDKPAVLGAVNTARSVD